MAAIITSAAQKLNADTAGQTKTGTEGNSVDAGPSPAEVITSVAHRAGGDLQSMFNYEPGQAPAQVSSPSTITPTSATRGPNGGLVPAALSRLRTGMAAPSPGPGPQGAAIPAKVTEVASGVKSDTVATAQDARKRVTNAITATRKLFRV